MSLTTSRLPARPSATHRGGTGPAVATNSGRTKPGPRAVQLEATVQFEAAVELDAAAPFHVNVAQVQARVALGTRGVLISGVGAAAVASRLLRLFGGAIDVVVRLDELQDDAAATDAARDAVALAGIAGGRATVEVPSARDLALMLDAVRDALRTPPASPTRFGGDAFTATIRLPWPVAVDVRIRDARSGTIIPLAA